MIRIAFTGILNDKLRGFYRSTFTDEAEAEHVIATTQFEATDARRAFPCWDEPDCKAVFAITLHVEPGLTVVSNAAIASEAEEADGRRAVRFADTMSMSTYLVAFVVGPLEATAPVDVDGTPLRIVHPPGKGHLTDFGAEIAAFSLRYLADYFDLPYAGDSMDLVAIPDFAFGAMENLGCVTFRETLLLADPDGTTQGEQQNVVDVIAHELAHMWFGDLVTMGGGTGIWLNEAFATFMEMKVTDAFRPDWKRWVGFGLSRSQAFDTDALASTRPIEYPVISPADAEGMFDILTYEKGAAVVRMLEQYLGEDRFREGIRRYMTAHAYGNTETTDLWDAIEAATGEPVRRIMDSWIFQGGHPIVSVELDADGRVLRLAQERFRYLPDPEATDVRWAVPVQLRYGTVSGEVASASVLLDGAVSSRSTCPRPPPGWWATPRATASTGSARRRRSARRWWPAPQAQLSDVERYGLVDDTWASVLAGATEPEAFVAMAEGFADEADVAVWRRIVGGLAEIDRCLAPGDRPAFQARVAAIVGPALERLGWDAPRRRAGPRPRAARPADRRRGHPRRRSRRHRPRARAVRPGAGRRPGRGQRGRRRAAGGRRRGRRGGGRSARGGLPGRPHAAGGAALPVRAGRGPRPRPVRARARAGHLQRGAHPERAVPARGLHREPRQRPHRVGHDPRRLGRAERALPVEQHRPHAQRHPGAVRPRRRGRRRGVPRRPPAAAGQADRGPAPRAHAGRGRPRRPRPERRELPRSRSG